MRLKQPQQTLDAGKGRNDFIGIGVTSKEIIGSRHFRTHMSYSALLFDNAFRYHDAQFASSATEGISQRAPTSFFVSPFMKRSLSSRIQVELVIPTVFICTSVSVLFSTDVVLSFGAWHTGLYTVVG